ncbi:MAG: Tn3 family transposase [Sphingomonadales bacterium]|nr:Tn3 family transposase [Sphingomonadales bacterium]
MNGGTINVKAIEDDWKEVLHLAASIRTGTVNASVMLKMLAGYTRQHSFSRASREIGRVERFLFMLDWLNDIDLRRRTNANFNKGEARNSLARAVFFNRLGELRDCTFENQRHRASGLNLVSAAIILWNTVYLGSSGRSSSTTRPRHRRRIAQPCGALGLGAHQPHRRLPLE